MGFLVEAQEILQILEELFASSPKILLAAFQEESRGAKPLSDSIAERDIRNLYKTMARMNFSNLICIVTHQSPTRAGLMPQSADRLCDALERLRPRLSLKNCGFSA